MSGKPLGDMLLFFVYKEFEQLVMFNHGTLLYSYFMNDSVMRCIKFLCEMSILFYVIVFLFYERLCHALY
jgi:hypothetical protein